MKNFVITAFVTLAFVTLAFVNIYTANAEMLTGPQKNAVRTATSYLNMLGFSCKGLIEQLSSQAGSKFTVDQATYGAHKAGAC
jgi:hypothetical protein